MKERFAGVFRTKTRDEWEAVFAGTDACVAPVLSLAEAPEHPHNVARETFVEIEGVVQPRPAPRLSRTDPEIRRPAARGGEHTDEILGEWGFSAEERAKLRESEAIR